MKVKGCPDQVLTLKFTRHGPVVYEDPAAGRIYAVRAAYFERARRPISSPTS